MNPRAVVRYLRPASWQTSNRTMGVAAAVAVVSWYFGADALHALVLAVAVTAVAAALRIDVGVADSGWGTDTVRRLRGSRSELAELSLSLQGRDGRSLGKGRAVGRIRDLARQRLAERGLSLLTPSDRYEIERLLGPRAFAVIAAPQRRRITFRAVTSCLDALEALDRRGRPDG